MSQLSPTVKLSNGTQMPLFGLGTFKTLDKNEMTNLIRAALDIGYRHIDTAIAYGNEAMIGESLQVIFNEGKYKREDLFIVSKVHPFKDYDVLEKIQESLKKLQIEYLDLFYLHFPFAAPKEGLQWNHKPVHVIWPEFEEAQKRGYTKSIGVSNFNVQSLVDLLCYCKIKPVSNQVELHVFLQQQRLVDFCKKADIHVTAYSPLARYGDVVQNDTLKSIAQKHNAEISQILLGFCLNLGFSVIPKTDKISRLSENFQSINIKLTEEDIQELKKLEKGLRVVQTANLEFFGFIPIYD